MEKEAKSQVRKQKQDNRLFFLVSKDLMQLLVYGLNPITPRPLPKNKKRDDSIFQDVFYDLLQISYSRYFCGDSYRATPGQKHLFRAKEYKIIEKEEKEKVLAVRVSMRGRNVTPLQQR